MTRVLFAFCSAVIARSLQVVPLLPSPQLSHQFSADEWSNAGRAMGEWDLASELDGMVSVASNAFRQPQCDLNGATWLDEKNCSHFVNDRICAERRRIGTYLASYPCSGNTWMRAILQAVTKIRTGSMYHDGFLVKAGFTGEGVTEPRRVLGVKTHAPVIFGVSSQARAIVLVRHPLPAALSYMQYRIAEQHGGSWGYWGSPHVAEVPFQLLRSEWPKSRLAFLRQWAQHSRFWIDNKGEKLIAKFEEIVANPEKTYSNKILPFLGLRGDDYRSQLSCALAEASRNGLVHRNHTYKFNFDADDVSAAKSVAGAEMEHFGYH